MSQFAFQYYCLFVIFAPCQYIVTYSFIFSKGIKYCALFKLSNKIVTFIVLFSVFTLRHDIEKKTACTFFFQICYNHQSKIHENYIRGRFKKKLLYYFEPIVLFLLTIMFGIKITLM